MEKFFVTFAYPGEQRSGYFSRPSETKWGRCWTKEEEKEVGWEGGWKVVILFDIYTEILTPLFILCFSFTHPIREGLPFLVELTPEGGENRVARLQLSVTEVLIIIYCCLCLPRNDIWNVRCMFGLIFQTQVPNFCLTSRRTGELVLARTRQNLISTLHHRHHCN